MFRAIEELLALVAEILCFLPAIIIMVWNTLVFIISFVMGILFDPMGFMIWLMLHGVDIFLSLLPQTPEALTLNHLVSQLGSSTGLGVGLFAQILQSASRVLLLVVAIKIYKLIPFKMT